MSESIEKFECWASKVKSGPVEPWSYTPRAMKPYEVDVKITSCGMCGR